MNNENRDVTPEEFEALWPKTPPETPEEQAIRIVGENIRLALFELREAHVQALTTAASGQSKALHSITCALYAILGVLVASHWLK